MRFGARLAVEFTKGLLFPMIVIPETRAREAMQRDRYMRKKKTGIEVTVS